MSSSLERLFQKYTEELNKAANDPHIQLALSRGVKSYRENTAAALKRFPHTVKLAEEVRALKEAAIERMDDLVAQARESIEANHGKTYLARTGEEALKIAADIIGTGKIVVKGKSIVGEELEVRDYLIEKGNEVWETDLGEFLLQLQNGRPMHIVSPSIHVPREKVAEVFTKFFGREIPPDIAAEVGAVREFMREKYFSAHFGISGANVVAADCGAMVIIENEGNARLCTAVPPVHIVMVGIEKIVPTFQDAMKVAEVTWRYANYTVPGYINIISGPSKTGDIEKVTTYGAHGPRELHVIFVDNGRSAMAADPLFKQGLYCLRCGGCMYECPVFQLTAGYFGYRYLGGIGAIWTAFVAGGLENAAPLIFTCLRCGRCVERCPVSIDVPSMIAELRRRIVELSQKAG
ncbi:LUD domain-containing protein [Neomoorella humiferrea]|uniref:Lactate utilization protein B n=1 Tax=Neomoorella humiferrea TaxID=676965 RepID=A0A2T0APY5_9FIRM|nr:lactate utilization protein B [Moorella humiferrea]PRR71092.1 Lactate utilization protein B [Moorella humiferrea]